MEKIEYDYYNNNRGQYDFTGIEPGTIVGVELMGAFNIIPDVPDDFGSDKSFIYYIKPMHLDYYCEFNDKNTMTILMEVVDEHTGKEIKSGREFLIGDEETDLYIEKDLQTPNKTKELEQQVFARCARQPIVLSPISIIKVNDDETKKQIYENYDEQKFLDTVAYLTEYAIDKFTDIMCELVAKLSLRKQKILIEEETLKKRGEILLERASELKNNSLIYDKENTKIR